MQDSLLSRLKRRLLNLLLRKLFNSLTDEDLLKVQFANPQKTAAKLFVGGKELSENTCRELISEAKFFQKSQLLPLLMSMGKVKANECMYQNSTKYDDMFFGKAVLWFVDILQGRIDLLASLVEVSQVRGDPKETPGSVGEEA